MSEPERLDLIITQKIGIMRFAIVNGQKTEPKPRLKGACPNCRGEMIARCGRLKVWHWAHKGKPLCDQWWENETEWHREWKNHFPIEWQECCLRNRSTGEKHIVKVRAKSGLVIEFQHSYLNSEEQEAREGFYKKMVWVVDGSRLKRDFPRFLKEVKHFEPSHMPGVFLASYPEECFQVAWTTRSVAVFFDFEGVPEHRPDNAEKSVWCLMPDRVPGRSVVIALKQKDFVEAVQHGNLVNDLKKIFENARKYRELIIQKYKMERKLMESRNIRRRRRRYSRF